MILDSWPGQMRTVYGDHERFRADLLLDLSGKYFTGDGCRRDAAVLDHRPRGRRDRRVGHRMGTAEVESALVAHPKVSEAAVVVSARHQGKASMPT